MNVPNIPNKYVTPAQQRILDAQAKLADEISIILDGGAGYAQRIVSDLMDSPNGKEAIKELGLALWSQEVGEAMGKVASTLAALVDSIIAANEIPVDEDSD